MAQRGFLVEDLHYWSSTPHNYETESNYSETYSREDIIEVSDHNSWKNEGKQLEDEDENTKDDVEPDNSL